MGNTIILTKNHPSELSHIEKAEAYQITLRGRASGPQTVLEQHGWWNEREQKAEFLVTTFEPETPLPFEEAQRIYFDQITKRVAQGFAHSRSYSFNKGRFVYCDLREVEGYTVTLASKG